MITGPSCRDVRADPLLGTSMAQLFPSIPLEMDLARAPGVVITQEAQVLETVLHRRSCRYTDPCPLCCGASTGTLRRALREVVKVGLLFPTDRQLDCPMKPRTSTEFYRSRRARSGSVCSVARSYCLHILSITDSRVCSYASTGNLPRQRLCTGGKGNRLPARPP